MEVKKVTYSGLDTEDVTRQLEDGNDKMVSSGKICSAPPPFG